MGGVVLHLLVREAKRCAQMDEVCDRFSVKLALTEQVPKVFPEQLRLSEDFSDRIVRLYDSSDSV